MDNLRNEIYTENDIYYAIADGEVYIEPNIRCALSEIEDYFYHAYPDDSEFLIDFKTMYVEAVLGSADDPVTSGYMEFKDGSYMRLELSPTWSTGELPIITNMAFSLFFGLMDPTTETVTEYRLGSATGLASNKRYWLPSPGTFPAQWEMTELLYIPGDTFRLYFGWWDIAIPKFRYIFTPYSSGGGVYKLEDWKNSLNRNVLSSGLQSGIDVATETGQLLAAYLCGGYTGSTEYPGEDSEAGGGDGTYYNVNDAIEFTPIQNIQAIDFGFNTIYNPREADMRAISDWLWSGDYTDSVKLNQISPMENILNIAIVALPESKIEKELSYIKIAGIPSGVQSRKVTNQYVELNCGTLPVSEYWGGYLDYDANFSIWLPYIGFRSLKPADILRGDLTVRYVIDLLTGAAVCEIRSILPDPQIKNRVVPHILYSYNCNVFYNIAISCSNYMNMYNQQFNATVSGISNFVAAGAQIAGAAASGNVLGVVGGALNLVSGGARAKQSYDSAKPEFGRGGNSGGNSGFFSYKKPYLVRSQPKEQSPKNYKKLQGVPAEIYAKLSTLSGYTEIDKVIVDTLIHCTSEEKTSILAMLSSGIYL